MSDSVSPHLGKQTPPRPGNHVLWLVPFFGVVIWQVWMTLGLFGARQEPARLFDDRPLVSGRHPLHLYHGYLGAASLLQGRGLSCYDPNFHAGYPKTPVFDSGSRPAELALALGGGLLRPGAYKLAVALVCAAVPLLLWLGGAGWGCRGRLLCWQPPSPSWCGGAGLAAKTSRPATSICYSPPCWSWPSRDCSSAFTAPGPWVFTGLVVAGSLGWFTHPLLMVLLLPSFFAFYLGAGRRHPLAWHLTLFGGLIGAIVANLFWLVDWVRYWWIRVPLRLDMPLLAHRTFRTIWEAPLWGGESDRVLGVLLVVTALIGLALWNRGGQRPTARLFGLSLLALLVLAVAGIATEQVGRLGAARLVVPALLFAILPAAHAISAAIGRMQHVAASGVTAACVVLPCLAGFAGPSVGTAWFSRLGNPVPLESGLTADREAIVKFLKHETTGEARILWEDRRGDRLASRWTALLPVLTGRSLIGGLDPDAGIEHVGTGLVDQTLCGRPVRDWTDDQLRGYCERYNVGWVVCWTAESTERFAAWSEAEPMADLRDGCDGRVFAVQSRQFVYRRHPSFALTGSAHWVRADFRHIVLEDVRPDNGEVVLSLHYQAGLRVTPSRVRIERATDPRDPIPFVRLLVKDPVARSPSSGSGAEPDLPQMLARVGCRRGSYTRPVRAELRSPWCWTWCNCRQSNAEPRTWWLSEGKMKISFASTQSWR